MGCTSSKLDCLFDKQRRCCLEDYPNRLGVHWPSFEPELSRFGWNAHQDHLIGGDRHLWCCAWSLWAPPACQQLQNSQPWWPQKHSHKVLGSMPPDPPKSTAHYIHSWLRAQPTTCYIHAHSMRLLFNLWILPCGLWCLSDCPVQMMPQEQELCAMLLYRLFHGKNF